MKALVLALLVGCSAPQHAAPATPAAPAAPIPTVQPALPVPSYVKGVLARWDGWGLKVKVASKPCGYDNAWYDPPTRTVQLCDDLFSRPALTRHILNHELAHAFQYQRGLANDVDIEFEADELGFWFDFPEETAAAIEGWSANPTAGGHTHPLNQARADMLACLRDGVMGQDVNTVCGMWAKSSFEKWQLLRLKVHPRG